MIDTERLTKAIRNFEFYAKPSNANGSAPCTIDDLKDVISEVAKVLKVFVDEIDKDQDDL